MVASLRVADRFCRAETGRARDRGRGASATSAPLTVLIRTILLPLLALMLISAPARADGPEEVDVALVLAVDISYSMDPDELAIQR
jgi:hypothetical protein